MYDPIPSVMKSLGYYQIVPLRTATRRQGTFLGKGLPRGPRREKTESPARSSQAVLTRTLSLYPTPRLPSLRLQRRTNAPPLPPPDSIASTTATGLVKGIWCPFFLQHDQFGVRQGFVQAMRILLLPATSGRVVR